MPADTVSTLPRTLALIDDDADHSEFLAQHPQSRGVDVSRIAGSKDLLNSSGLFDQGFCIVDLMLAGADGPDRPCGPRC